MVQVVAILTSLAFGGVIIVVMGLIFFGGGGTSAQQQAVNDAKSRVEREPRSTDAWQGLASAYFANDQRAEAVSAAQRAVALAPRDIRAAQTLVSVQPQPAAKVAAMQAFTEANPKNADGFSTLGQLAEQAGSTALARLAYQRFLQLRPDDRLAAEVRARIKQLGGS